MNSLNSVLIEGELEKNPFFFHRDGKNIVVLRLKFNLEGSTVAVEVSGRQAEVCLEHLRQGRGVRVVGSLSREREPGYTTPLASSGLFIKADHVEFKPESEKPEDKPVQWTTLATTGAKLKKALSLLKNL